MGRKKFLIKKALYDGAVGGGFVHEAAWTKGNRRCGEGDILRPKTFFGSIIQRNMYIICRFKDEYMIE